MSVTCSFFVVIQPSVCLPLPLNVTTNFFATYDRRDSCLIWRFLLTMISREIFLLENSSFYIFVLFWGFLPVPVVIIRQFSTPGINKQAFKTIEFSTWPCIFFYCIITSVRRTILRKSIQFDFFFIYSRLRVIMDSFQPTLIRLENHCRRLQTPNLIDIHLDFKRVTIRPGNFPIMRSVCALRAMQHIYFEELKYELRNGRNTSAIGPWCFMATICNL
jgi:hypothetical protein